MLSVTQATPGTGTPETTTAQILGDFHRELLAQRLPNDVVTELVAFAGRTLIDDDRLVLRAADQGA